MMGQEVSVPAVYVKGTSPIKIGDIPDGLYIVRMSAKNWVGTAKLLKQ